MVEEKGGSSTTTYIAIAWRKVGFLRVFFSSLLVDCYGDLHVMRTYMCSGCECVDFLSSCVLDVNVSIDFLLVSFDS